MANKGDIPGDGIYTVIEKAQRDGWLIGQLTDETRKEWVKKTVEHFVKNCPSERVRHAAQFAVYLKDEIQFLLEENYRYMYSCTL